MDNDVRKVAIVNWSQITQDKNGWKRATREALVLLGKWRHRRRRRRKRRRGRKKKRRRSLHKKIKSHNLNFGDLQVTLRINSVTKCKA